MRSGTTSEWPSNACRDVDSLPQTEDESKQRELRGLVAAVNEPEHERPLGELVVDAEAGCRDAKAGDEARLQGSGKWRFGSQQNGKPEGGNQRKDEADAKDFGRMPGLRLRVVFASPDSAKQQWRIPKAAEQEAGNRSYEDGE
jgi:hypothetical protein